MKFLFDNNLSPQLARAISELSKKEVGRVDCVIPLRDRFAQNAPDTVWMEELAKEGGWSIVSGDYFRKSSAERELARQAGFVVFVLDKSWASHPYWTKAAQLVLWWPRILDQTEQVAKAAYRVPWRASGKFEQIRV